VVASERLDGESGWRMLEPGELLRVRPDLSIDSDVVLPDPPARLVLLDQVAQAFEPGRRYPEQAVNEILKAVYDDHAALRRYLIDESLLSRTPDGTYWRSGGTVPIAQDGPGVQES